LNSWTIFDALASITRDVLSLFAGREATDVFYSYHKSETENYLNSGHIKYIGDLESTKFPIFTKKNSILSIFKKRS